MTYLRLSREQLNAIIRHCLESSPNEACGLIAGKGNSAELLLPVPNRAASPQQFVMDEKVLLQAFRQIDKSGADFLGIYHSHPVSDPVPSETDIDAALQYPGVVHVIVSLKYGTPRVKAWRIQAALVEDVEILTGSNSVDEIRHEHLSSAQQYAILLAALLACALMIGLSLSLLPPAPVIVATAFR